MQEIQICIFIQSLVSLYVLWNGWEFTFISSLDPLIIFHKLHIGGLNAFEMFSYNDTCISKLVLYTNIFINIYII